MRIKYYQIAEVIHKRFQISRDRYKTGLQDSSGMYEIKNLANDFATLFEKEDSKGFSRELFLERAGYEKD